MNKLFYLWIVAMIVMTIAWIFYQNSLFSELKDMKMINLTVKQFRDVICEPIIVILLVISFGTISKRKGTP